MPVRQVANRGGNASGKFPSLKMNRMIAFESLIERDYLYVLDYEVEGLAFTEQPLTITYHHDDKERHYTPDFHLFGRGQHVLVECKPERFVETEENLCKFAVAQEWCKKQGWEFRVVTDQQVRNGFRLQNVKLLAQYARQKVDIVIRSQIHTFLRETQEDMSIHNLAQAILPGNPSAVTASIFCLAYQHAISLSLDDAPISGATAVSLFSPKEVVS